MRRRDLLRLGLASLGGLSVLGSLGCATAPAPSRRKRASYGPLGPVRDATTGLELLTLPQGFSYLTYGWTGDPLDDGKPTPSGHDGMACFAVEAGRVRLIRNHERDGNERALFVPGAPCYDPLGPGGTTTLEFDVGAGRWLGAHASLTGTVRNCAGGPTPWASWLTCEESLSGPEKGLRERHGYVLEVPVSGVASGRPLRGLGRFLHEAVAVDPATGIVYETEDEQSAGFYRFVPEQRGDLTRGKLEMLAVRDRPGYDTRIGQPADVELPVEWVPIARPDPDDPAGDRVFSQGYALGGAVFRRLEGAFAHAGSIYFVATMGGDETCGQVWCHDPRAQSFRLLYESPGTDVLDCPDNIALSPRGGIVLCEDGQGGDFLRGLSPDGDLFTLCENRVRLSGERNGLAGDFTGSELAGACFDPTGRWLFVNVQNPGITFAITGPWERGSL